MNTVTEPIIAPTLPQNASAASQRKEVPGDLALWFFLMAELAAFGVMILGFAGVRIFQPDMFMDGLEKLHLSSGVINTLALLTGSFFAATAVHKVREQAAKSHLYLLGAAAFGCVYLFVKMTEYIDLYGQGYSLHYDTFFSFYFFATAFHYMHVLAGVVILLLVANWLRKTQDDLDTKTRAAESVASYWHMVDIVWIVLFPTLYLLK